MDYRQVKADPPQKKRISAIVAMEKKLIKLKKRMESDKRNQRTNYRGALQKKRKKDLRVI